MSYESHRNGGRGSGSDRGGSFESRSASSSHHDEYYQNGSSSSSSSYRGGYRGRARGAPYRGGFRGSYNDSYHSRGGSYRGSSSRSGSYYSRGGSYNSNYGDRDTDDTHFESRRREESVHSDREKSVEDNEYKERAGSTPTNHGHVSPSSSSSFRGSGSSYRGNFKSRNGSYTGSSYHSHHQTSPTTISKSDQHPSGGEYYKQGGTVDKNSRHYKEFLHDTKLKDFKNPWINILNIKDEKLQNNLEKNYIEQQKLDETILDLQKNKLKLEMSMNSLDNYASKEALHVQLTSEKLDEFVYI